MRFIFREFPLDQLAAAGFMLARCADQDKYFAMIETLFAKQRDWVVQKPLQPLLSIAKQAGFTEQSFNAVSEESAGARRHRADARTRASEKFNVQSTPTFFINGKIVRAGHDDRRGRQGRSPPISRQDKDFSTWREAAAAPWRPPQPVERFG